MSPTPDEDKEFHDWNDKARREEFEKHKKAQVTGTESQPPAQGAGPQDKTQETENRIAELEKVVSEAGLTKKSIDARANKEGKEDEDDLFGGLLDFDFLSDD